MNFLIMKAFVTQHTGKGHTNTSRLMKVFHAAVFAYGKTLAGRLKLFLANLAFLAGLQAFCGVFMSSNHGTMATDVLNFLLVGMLCVRDRRGHGKDNGQGHAQHAKADFSKIISHANFLEDYVD
jgi:hypothetical protein